MNKPEGFEFRPANDNEMAQFMRLQNYVFAEPPKEDDSPPPIIPEWTQCAFHGQKLAATSGGYPFHVYMNGKPAAIQGVTAVGTEPEFRRRGIVRQLITDLLHRAHKEGQVASILLASRGAIYQRFGYGLASTAAGYEFDPTKAVLQDPFRDEGHIERLSKVDAQPILSEVFRRYARPRNVFAARADVVWERLLSDAAKDHAYIAVHYNNDGKPDGYAVYKTEWKGNGQTMQITDLAWENISAWKSLWQYLCSHDLVEKVTWMDVPEDDPALAVLLEPRCLNRKTWDGLWLRPVNVGPMLEARGYQSNGTINIDVTNDTICSWNNGTWCLTVEGGEATVQSTKNKADLRLNPDTLGSLVSGHFSATQLERAGRLAAANPEQLALADSLFSTQYRGALAFGF